MLMKTITLPFLDHAGITPLVLDAMKNGAVSANHPTDHDKITLTFEDDDAADAFVAAITPPAPKAKK